MGLTTEKIAPTVEAIDAWRARQKREPKIIGDTEYQMMIGDHYEVNIWTKSSACRCITRRVEHDGKVWYWTIKGEGSSNGCREYEIPADKIVRAEGWMVAR
jgi:hypothetical protein